MIPGDPAFIRARAGDLRARSDQADDAGAGLRGIELGAWTGSAAREFEDRFADEPARWFNASDRLACAADALDSYAGTLAWAQAQAGAAVQQWDLGESLTRQAAAAYRAARGEGSVAAAFRDPGQGHREAAEAALDSARGQLRDAAASTAAVLREQACHAPESSSWWDGALDVGLDVGAGLVNTVASLGNAMVHHPEALAEMVGGTLLADAGGAGEVAGALLDVTGVGAPVGVAVNVATAGVIVTGVGLAAHGVATLAGHAATDDLMTPMRSNRSDSSNSERHGDGGRTSAKNQAEMDAAEAELRELIRTQGSRKDKQALTQKIRNLRRAGDRAAKGEEHSRGAKR